MNDLETRYQRMNRASLIALVGIGVAMLCSAVSITARENGWIDSGSLWEGLLAVGRVAGWATFGVTLLLSWRFGRRLGAEQRAQLRDELDQFLKARSVQRAFLVTMVVAAVIGALPSAVSWPGRAVAMTLFAIGVLTLAGTRLREEP